ncbi:hypothetical protein FS749_001380 [Ceratobasidium sp. UAMH 11750]|nr:hypothetical protein FS749_001380 [Ceratobasidium sp. UAMH 11750]
MNEIPSYVAVPTNATFLQPRPSNSPKSSASESPIQKHASPLSVSTTLEAMQQRSSAQGIASPISGLPQSPTRSSTLSIPSMLLAATTQSLPPAPSASPRETSSGSAKLLSNRDSLSIQITTANFRRFVSRSGPVFWFQDRVEEIFLWRCGWQYTVAWGSGYVFLCFYPRVLLILPQLALLAVLLLNYPGVIRPPTSPGTRPNRSPTRPPPQLQATEGSAEWYSNLQAIQNLMGAVSDAHELGVQLVPHLTWSTSATRPILLMTLLSLLLVLLPIPTRQIFLAAGLGPLCITHPVMQKVLPGIVAQTTPAVRVVVERLLDDLRMEERHVEARGGLKFEPRLPGFRTMHIPTTLKLALGLKTPAQPAAGQYVVPEPEEERMLEVELFENERWAAGAGWKAAHLRAGERRGFTRGRDGWSAGDGDVRGLEYGDVSSNLTFDLSPGWNFVETEDWRVDWVGSWLACGADNDGWVYTNDSWLNPRPFPPNELVQPTSGAVGNPTGPGVTRRRRWGRRIYRLDA